MPFLTQISSQSEEAESLWEAPPNTPPQQHCPLPSAGLAAWGEGHGGPWCWGGAPQGTRDGEASPEKGNTSLPLPETSRRLGKGFTLWLSLKTLAICSVFIDAGPCRNASFTGKQTCFRLSCLPGFN